MTEELKKQKRYFDELSEVVKMMDRSRGRISFLKYEKRFKELTDLIIQ